MRTKAFIAYCREDRKEAEQIYQFLYTNGCNPWMDNNLIPGTLFEKEIEREIIESDCVIICFSLKSVNKKSLFQKEIKRALDLFDHIPEGHTYLIPIRLEECELPFSFQKIQYLDWFAPDAKTNLLRAIENTIVTQDQHSKYDDENVFKMQQKKADEILRNQGIETIVKMLDFESKVYLLYIYRCVIEHWTPPGRYFGKELLYTSIKYETKSGVHGEIQVDNYSEFKFYDLQKKYGLGDDEHYVRKIFLDKIKTINTKKMSSLFDEVTIIDAIDWHSPK